MRLDNPLLAEVERHDFEGERVFPDTGTLRTFVASTKGPH